jgi:hypothetical protein
VGPGLTGRQYFGYTEPIMREAFPGSGERHTQKGGLEVELGFSCEDLLSFPKRRIAGLADDGRRKHELLVAAARRNHVT